jgi:hypothetical protein
MQPTLNRKGSPFVIAKIDEILAWSSGTRQSGTRGLWSWGGICAKFGRVSTGVWRT